jgi:peptidoglycan/LPS O-acetylase OafA/YrhL
MTATKLVRKFLGWNLWTPLAHLSFGAYLIHPIIIYVWFLSARQKVTFRLLTYVMDFCSITVVTFAASFAVTILVEFPLGILLRPPSGSGKARQRRRAASTSSSDNNSSSNGNNFNNNDAEMANLLVPSIAVSQLSNSQSYGSLQPRRQ